MEDLLEELSGPPLGDFYKCVLLTAALRHCRLAFSMTVRSPTPYGQTSLPIDDYRPSIATSAIDHSERDRLQRLRQQLPHRPRRKPKRRRLEQGSRCQRA